LGEYGVKEEKKTLLIVTNLRYGIPLPNMRWVKQPPRPPGKRVGGTVSYRKEGESEAPKKTRSRY